MHDKKDAGRIGLMALTSIVIIVLLIAVIFGFKLLKSRQEYEIASAQSTRYEEATVSIEDRMADLEEKEQEEEQNKEDELDLSEQEEELSGQAVGLAEEQDGSQEEGLGEDDNQEQEEQKESEKEDKKEQEQQNQQDQNKDIETGEDAGMTAKSTDEVYIVKGEETKSNKYEKADKLTYTDSVRYSQEELKVLDRYGLRITRNEIFARHGRMFNDQGLQKYFDNQSWYVAKYSPEDFDDSCLNQVERDNVNLILAYEQELGYQ